MHYRFPLALRPRLALLAGLALCLFTAAPARAQATLASVSPQKMTEILTSMGLEAKLAEKKGEQEPPLVFDLAGYNVMLFLANENTDGQLFVAFRGKVSTDRINEWNQKYRFTRAYRDKDGDPALESDIDFTGGVTEANVKAWVKMFRDQVGEYHRFVKK
jgi:hypothetical protein